MVYVEGDEMKRASLKRAEFLPPVSLSYPLVSLSYPPSDPLFHYYITLSCQIGHYDSIRFD
jgi:hypothetical protein